MPNNICLSATRLLHQHGWRYCLLMTEVQKEGCWEGTECHRLHFCLNLGEILHAVNSETYSNVKRTARRS